jgi:hypothetical protein
MSEPQPPRDELLRKINGKLTWVIVLLVLITLNTCELYDLDDAIRERSDEAPAASVPAAPATEDR